MLGLFPISADAIGGEGAAKQFDGVSSVGFAGAVTAVVTLALAGVDGTASASDFGGLGRSLDSLVATSAVESPAAAISKPLPQYTNDPFGLTVSLDSTIMGTGEKYWGFKFTTGSLDVTVSHLGRWKFSGNSQTHDLYLYKYVNGSGGDIQVASASVDASTGAAGDFLWGSLSDPVSLLLNTTYYVVSLEHAFGDSFADWQTSFSTQTPYVGTIGGSVSTFTLGSISDAHTGNSIYGPVNFKVVTAAAGGLEAATAVGAVLTGGITLDGASATGSINSTDVSAVQMAIAGNAATASVGTVDIPGTVNSSGVSATASGGSVGSADLVILSSGVAGTAGVGTVGVGTSNFSGVDATAGLGSLSVANVTRKLRGNAATASTSPLLQPLAPELTGDDARVRWVGHRILIDGTDMEFGLSGAATLDSSIEWGRQGVLSCRVSDSAWPAAGNLWGNKPAEAYLSVGTNPRKMTEYRVFTGYTYQKRDDAKTPAETSLTLADASAAYTGIPVCYSLGAYSGKTRGQVITEVAATVDVTLTDVPVGGIVNKPVTLNNASLLEWIADFGLVENWYPHVDRYGNLSVRVLNQPSAGWTVDADKGDFDLDTLQETYPTRSPCRWYVTGTKAVQITSDEEGAGPIEITTVQVDEEEALYNPKCRRSYDPTGYSLPAAELMVVARVTTETTTLGGDEIRRVTTTESFYNPESSNPNYNGWPTGTDYSEAYTDNSFHRDAVETLMETSKTTVTTTRDAVGTVLSQHTETLGWYAPQHSFDFVDRSRPERIVNNFSEPGSFIYSDGKSHEGYYSETYRIIGVVDTTYEYDPTNGTLLNQVSTIQGWYAPKTACDILVTISATGGLATARVSNATEPNGAPAPDPGHAVGYSTDWTDASGNHYYLNRRDYKWGEQDWRSQVDETFQMVKRVSTEFTVVDGQIASTRETTEQFVKFESSMNPSPLEFNSAPFLFGDGKWYEGTEQFGTSGVKFTHYEQFGSTGHAKTTYSVDLLTGEVTISPPAYSDGTMPLAPTIGSTLRWARLPMVLEVSVEGCEFIDSKQNLDLPWAENEFDLDRAGRRAAQRAMAIIREFDCAWNPLVEPGDGLLLTSREHGIIAEWHIITDIKASVENGADMHITAERWPGT